MDFIGEILIGNSINVHFHANEMAWKCTLSLRLLLRNRHSVLTVQVPANNYYFKEATYAHKPDHVIVYTYQ